MIAFTQGSNRIELPDPEFGDVEQSNIRVSLFHTMDGSPVAYRHTPVTRQFVMNLQGITRRRAEELRAFLQASGTQLITFFHFDGTTWRGYFTSPTFEIITESLGLGNLGRSEFSGIALEFEGRQI